MFEVTRRYLPPIEMVHLLDMVTFNVLACNTDAHAKNYSIMIRGNGLSLAPIYDVMCGEVWKNVTKKLAQAVAGKRQGDCLNASDWQRFARECGLNTRQIIERVRTLAKLVLAEARPAELEVAAMPAGEHAILSRTREAVEQRARSLFAQLREPGQESASEPPTPALLARTNIPESAVQA
jgi:serine/threonine-protein kinase HipA